jgi:UDP-GlcNAc:undecaprenyl-phosphate GlcNAc-1-phosphate transferase
MSSFLYLFIAPLILAAISSYVVTPVVIKNSSKLGIIDDPKKHKHISVIHKVPTPRGGGIPLFLGIAVSSIAFLPLDKHLIGILAGGLILTILGILDDKFNLNPYKRLIIQFIVATIPVAAGIGIAFIRIPLLAELIDKTPFFNGFVNADPATGIIDLSNPKITFDIYGKHSIWLLSDTFAIFWIVSLMNFVNIGASGLDGQLTGTTIISAIIISILSLRYSSDTAQWPVLTLAAATAGSYLGFLPWHIYPQKIMPGFGGSTLAGFMLAILSILSTTKVGTLMLLLAIPIIDTIFVFLRRILQGKSPFWGDRSHLHHKLLDAGMSKNQVAMFYWTITAILGIAALNLNAESKFYTIIGISVLLIGFLTLLTPKKTE